MGFVLTPLETIEPGISREDFYRTYVKPRRPVVIKGFAKSWPAFEKWTPEYLKEVVGEKEVPLYDNSKADASKKLNEPIGKMKFTDYMDLIRREPTELRLFAFDIFKYAPGLLKDYRSPTELMGGFLERFPYLFFGGSDSETFLHYDIDLPHIFHTHFQGRKHVILFENKWKERLYKIPLSTYALEDYKVANPDVNAFPALDGVPGKEVILEHGDTLFMPTGYWHWMKYLEGSYSISLRAWDKSWWIKTQSLYNLFVKRNLDNTLKKVFKNDYYHYKERLAVKIAHRNLEPLAKSA